ncbi:tetratricopeptide repeat-containing sulfotransferase family protein [Arenimonas sp.]|uniref:tetratricopeptide repeat-containing sulfotransferase family protein n=1 Tax=Arenimonas sp. TaxID=1872635 RepID=UPI0039E6799E
MALLLLGRSHAARGEAMQAAEVLRQLATKQPQWALAQYELGIALGRAGQGDEALSALRRAIELKADLPQAWLALGDHLTAVGDNTGAAEAYSRHVRHSIRDPALMSAAAALHDNRLPEAERLLKQHLYRMPTDVAAMRMLAELAVRLGRNEDAENLLARALELAPGFREARQNLALVLYRGNQPDEALKQIEVLLADDARNPAMRNLKAAILCRIGEFAAGIALYEQLLREYPTHPRIWLSYAHTLKTEGRQDESVRAYRRSIECDPAFGEAWWSLANLKTYRFSADDIAAMRRQLARDSLDEEHRLHFDFALGKALEDAGEYEASFRHYDAGNRLRLRRVPYSAGETSARVEFAKKTYDESFFADRAGWGDPSPDPIFIVGLPRAGSTLIEQILSSHPQVEGTQELPEIISITRALRRRAADDSIGGYHRALAELGADEVRALGREYLQRTRIQRKTDAPFFIDKMPNNFLHLGLIRLILPNARIVDARRHPLGCCLSNFKQHFARGQNFSYSLEDIGRYYHDYIGLMAHYDRVQPGAVHRAFHERMVEDSEGEIRHLLEACGLPFDERCLRFHENERAVRTASSEQVRRPINRDGVNQWRHFAPWLEPLKLALGPVLDAYPAVPDSFAHPRV